jgi:hypothetical protein
MPGAAGPAQASDARLPCRLSTNVFMDTFATAPCPRGDVVPLFTLFARHKV